MKDKAAKIPNIVIQRISSKVPAAIIALGIYFFLPYPSLSKAIQLGTIIEGLIQANV